MNSILCIETGTAICSVAIARNGELISLRESPADRDHARQLGVFVDEILEANGLRADELSAVAVSSGPGSYTGLRIGVSLAKGLCYGAGIPLIAVGSLEALAHTAMEDFRAGLLDVKDIHTARLCPMIDARRMEVYAQVFDSSLRPLSDVSAEVVGPESFSQWMGGPEFVIFGDGAAKCASVLGAGVKTADATPSAAGRVELADVTPSARGQVRLAHEAYLEGRFADTAYFEPFYLKDFVIKTSSRKLF